MKFIFILILVLSLNPARSQNVGIGTLTPTESLEIKRALRSTLKIGTTSYNDTSQISLSNRDGSGNGTDYLMTAIREQGLYFTSKSDLSANNSDSLLIIKTNGNIGLSVLNPTAKLEVNGGMKLRGTNVLEFGAGIAGKETNAGKIGYNSFSANSLDIVGAGTNASNRRVYFFAEGGTTFSGPATVLNNLNVGGQLQLNGSPGTVGQVITSNGTSNPVWKAQAYNNSVRFAVQLAENTGLISGDSRITATQYNLSPADISIGANAITINKTGLYHFDVGMRLSVTYTAAANVVYPRFGIWLFGGSGNAFVMANDRIMSSYSTSNTSWYGDEKNSMDVYITAGSTVRVYHTISTVGVGTVSTYSASGFLAGYLISE